MWIKTSDKGSIQVDFVKADLLVRIFVEFGSIYGIYEDGSQVVLWSEKFANPRLVAEELIKKMIEGKDKIIDLDAIDQKIGSPPIK